MYFLGHKIKFRFSKNENNRLKIKIDYCQLLRLQGHNDKHTLMQIYDRGSINHFKLYELIKVLRGTSFWVFFFSLPINASLFFNSHEHQRNIIFALHWLPWVYDAIALFVLGFFLLLQRIAAAKLQRITNVKIQKPSSKDTHGCNLKEKRESVKKTPTKKKARISRNLALWVCDMP